MHLRSIASECVTFAYSQLFHRSYFSPFGNRPGPQTILAQPGCHFGTVNKMMAALAKPSVRGRAWWLWTRYRIWPACDICHLIWWNQTLPCTDGVVVGESSFVGIWCLATSKSYITTQPYTCEECCQSVVHECMSSPSARCYSDSFILSPVYLHAVRIWSWSTSQEYIYPV